MYGIGNDGYNIVEHRTVSLDTSERVQLGVEYKAYFELFKFLGTLWLLLLWICSRVITQLAEALRSTLLSDKDQLFTVYSINARYWK